MSLSLDELMYGAAEIPCVEPEVISARLDRAEANALAMQMVPAYETLFKSHEDDPSSIYYGLPYRYKVMHGGRGGAKSQSVAMALVALAYSEKCTILCTREYQTSIRDSVHKMLKKVINDCGLWPYFIVQEAAIYCPSTGSEFIFKGMHGNEQGIKSTEGVDYCWIEEAQTTTHESLLTLIPTVRKETWRDGRLHMSQIWLTFNLLEDDSPVNKEFILKDPGEPGLYAAWVRKINYDENPYFPATLEAERRKMERLDPDNYTHVWLGFPRRISEATIFRHRVEVCDFESPDPRDSNTRFYFGADYGFANDPSTLIRMFIKNNCLYIDYEAYRKHVELDEMHAFYEEVPLSHKWLIMADAANPQIISYLGRGQERPDGTMKPGFQIQAAEKWPGSIEDGITHLKGFEKIYVHTRCPYTAAEFRLYSWKLDKRTSPPRILPVPVDDNNHAIDAIRYGLSDFIQVRGAGSEWAAMAQD